MTQQANPPAAEQNPVERLEEAIRTHGGEDAPRVDLSGPRRRAETMQTVAFCFHAHLDIPNLGHEGFKFGVQHAKLRRLSPIMLPVFPAVRIKKRTAGVGFLGTTAAPGAAEDGFEYGGAVPAGGGRDKHIERHDQMPSVSAGYLVTAYKKFGMVKLSSLTAQGDEEVGRHLALFNALFRADFAEGLRAADLIVEKWPDFLKRVAPELLRRHVSLVGGDDLRERGERLIAEVTKSVEGLRAYALDPSAGVLPVTKQEMEVASKSGRGKFFLNAEDHFLLEQFPSYRPMMGTLVESAQEAARKATEDDTQSAADSSAALLELAKASQEANRLNAEALAQNRAILDEMIASRKQTDDLIRALAQK